MEIQTLSLFLTDADLAKVIALVAHSDTGVEDLAGKFTPEGIVVTGRYPTMFLRVPFETVWVVEPAGPELRVSLASIRIGRVPAGPLRGLLLSMVRDVVAQLPGTVVRDEVIVIHAPDVARARGVDLQVRFTAVRLSIGAAVVEAGT